MIINDTYRVTTSERNVVLEKYIVPIEKFKAVDGIKVSQGMSKGGFELLGYYPSHQAAIRAYVADELRGVPQEINELLRKIDEVMVVIEGLVVR